MPTIFEGVNNLIDQSLGVLDVGETAPHYRHKACLKRLMVKPQNFDACKLLNDIAGVLESNWQDNGRKRGSRENWRWEKQLYISDRNASPEKQFEKAVVTKCRSNWVNQVPTASGLTNSTEGRLCNIDLVHWLSNETCEFIELKYDSDTPLFAAFEILKYGLLYVFTRQHLNDLTVSPKTRLLAANNVHLRVVAPASYYINSRLVWLPVEVNHALNQRLANSDFRMDFKFESINWEHGGDVCAEIKSRRDAF